MFITHPRLEGPRWISSCFDCPQHFYWSTNGNTGTTGTSRWWHSPSHKGFHKPQLQDGEAQSRGDVLPPHMKQTKQDRWGGRLSLVQHPQSASNRLTICPMSTGLWRTTLQKSTRFSFGLESVIVEQVTQVFLQKSKKENYVFEVFVCDTLAAVHFIKQASMSNEIIW